MNSLEKIQYYLRQGIPFMVSKNGEITLLEEKQVKNPGKQPGKKSIKKVVYQPTEIVDKLVSYNPDILPLPGLTPDGEISGKIVTGIKSWSEQGNSGKEFKNNELTKNNRKAALDILKEYLTDYKEFATEEVIETLYGTCKKYSWESGFQVLVDKKENILDGKLSDGTILFGWEKDRLKPKKLLGRYPKQKEAERFSTINTRIPTPDEQRKALENGRIKAAEDLNPKYVVRGRVKDQGKIYENEQVKLLLNWKEFVLRVFQEPHPEGNLEVWIVGNPEGI